MTVFDEGGYDGDDRSPQSNAEFAALRKANQATKRAEAERDQAKRETAFLRAGIDPDAGGIAAYFVKGYEGPLSKAEIQKAAQEAGILTPPAPTAQEQALAAEPGAAAAVAGYASDATAAPTASEGQRAALEEAYRGGGMDALIAAAQQSGVPIVEN